MSSVKRGAILTAVLLSPLILFADPVVYLYDQFDDGERHTQNLPDSATWFATHTVAGVAEIVDKGGGEYVLGVGDFTTDTPRGAVAYFTEEGSPATLTAQNNVLRYSFDFTPTAETVTSDSIGMRFVLLESLSDRLSTDTLGNVTARGYGIFLDPETGDFLLRTRNTNQGNYLSTFGNYDAMYSSRLFGLTGGVTYRMTIEAVRLSNNNIKLSVFLSDGTNMAGASYVDHQHQVYSFDTVGFAVRPMYTGLSEFDNIKVERLSEPDTGFQVGWASADITPDPAAGVLMENGQISTGAMDSLSATVLALDSEIGLGSDKIIWISCDLPLIPDGSQPGFNMLTELRSRLIALIPGLLPDQVIVTATHTDQAPAIADPQNADYAEDICDRIALAAQQAWAARQPGGISYGLGHAVVGHQRVVSYREGQQRTDFPGEMDGNTLTRRFSHLEGFEDHSVNLLYTWDVQTNLTGVIVNLASPALVHIGGDTLSAGFWNETREELAQRLGANVHVMALTSAAGDQSPEAAVKRRAEERMQQALFPGVETGRGSPGRRKQVALRIANTVVSVLPYMEPRIDFDPVFAHSKRVVNLPGGFPETDPQAPVYPAELHGIRLGESVLITSPFSLYLDYGVRIKGRSAATQTFVVQRAGGGPYLPTWRGVAGGAYGATADECIVGPDSGQQMVEQSLQIINNDLW